MYIVTIRNQDGTEVNIHDERERLASGKIVQSINAIDSFTFSLYPSNAGFNMLQDYQTLVTVYNTVKQRYEFRGRVLCTTTSMDDNGLITRDATCESDFGFLCDSQQAYIAEKNWAVRGLLIHIIAAHNGQVEAYKRFELGEVTVTDPNNNLYVGIQRQNTWTTLKEKLIDVLGGEIRFRVKDGIRYLDYLTAIGEEKDTPIELSMNMKAITREKDPSAYITRLIPLGEKLGDDTEERLEITSINGGKNYIDDAEAIEAYGIHVGYVEWDDVTTKTQLLAKGKAWLAENNKVQVKYSITALDLSLLGLVLDDFQVHNFYPIRNSLLGIDDTARVIKKTIDICDDTKSSIEVGDNFKTLSELRNEEASKLQSSVTSIKGGVASTNKTVTTIVGSVDLINRYNGAESVISVQDASEYTDKDQIYYHMQEERYYGYNTGTSQWEEVPEPKAGVSSVAKIQQVVDEQGASIGLLVENGEVKGSIVVEAINGQSAAQIKADHIHFEGESLDIRVKSSYIEGQLNADQINATGLKLKMPGSAVDGWYLELVEVPLSANADDTEQQYALYSPKMQAQEGSDHATYQVYLTPKGVYLTGQHDDGVVSGAVYYRHKTWYQLLGG